MHDALTTAAGVLTALVTLAIVAVLVSNNAQTANVLTSGGQAFGGIISAAVAPVSSNGTGIIGG